MRGTPHRRPTPCLVLRLPRMVLPRRRLHTLPPSRRVINALVLARSNVLLWPAISTTTTIAGWPASRSIGLAPVGHIGAGVRLTGSPASRREGSEPTGRGCCHKPPCRGLGAPQRFYLAPGAAGRCSADLRLLVLGPGGRREPFACCLLGLRCHLCLSVPNFSGPYVWCGQFATRHGDLRLHRWRNTRLWLPAARTCRCAEFRIMPEVAAARGIGHSYGHPRRKRFHRDHTRSDRNVLVQAELRLRGNVIIAVGLDLHDDRCASVSRSDSHGTSAE